MLTETVTMTRTMKQLTSTMPAVGGASLALKGHFNCVLLMTEPRTHVLLSSSSPQLFMVPKNLIQAAEGRGESGTCAIGLRNGQYWGCGEGNQ